MATPSQTARSFKSLNLIEIPEGFPNSAAIVSLEAAWRDKCRDGRLPARSDFPAETLRKWIGRVSLVDVIHEPRRFRWRLIGTQLALRFGRDASGSWFEDLYQGAVLDSYVELYSAAVDQRRPVYYAGDLEFVGREFLHFASVHLPLSEDGERVNMLMLYLSFDGD